MGEREKDEGKYEWDQTFTLNFILIEMYLFYKYVQL